MKRHIRFLAVLLSSALLCLSLSGCFVALPVEGPEEPIPPRETQGTETESNIHIQTGVPDTDGPDTAPALRTVYGTVVAWPDGEAPAGVLTVQAPSGPTIFFVYTEQIEDFCVGDEVEFTYDTKAAPLDMGGVEVLEALEIVLLPVPVPEKPVIYLYPETPTEVSVKLTLDGRLTCTYPAYGEGWQVTAHPDGTLTTSEGGEYYCLYWEGIQRMDCNFSRGFCVKGSDTVAFLEWVLAEQGLTPREANEFIIYWLPRMEKNPYNVISFQTEAYTEGAVLDIQPNPDSLLRVFMAWYPSEEAVEMEAQAFTPFRRVGFAVVEWGGCELTEAP